MKVKIGDHEFDALTTIDRADRFLAGDVSRAARWAVLQEAAKGRGIVSATRKLLTLTWCADRPDPTADEQSEIVQEVTAMLAADLVAKPRLMGDASGNSNVKIAKAGSAQVEFFTAVTDNAPLPGPLWLMLKAAGLVCDATTASDDDGAMAGAFVSGASSGCRPVEGRWSDYGRDGYYAEDRD